MHQPAFPWLCCPKLFDALVCHGQACLAQGLLVLLWSGSPAPYIDCQLHSDLCPNRQLSSSCPLCQSSHCIALSCIVLSLMAIFYCTALYQLVLHHCVNLYPDKSPLCPWRPAPCLWRKQLSALIVQEKPHPDLIDPNPCCVTERSNFGSKLPADLGLLLVLLWTVWKMSLQRDPDSGLIVTNHGEAAYFEFNCGRRAKPVTGSCSIITWEASTLN